MLELLQKRLPNLAPQAIAQLCAYYELLLAGNARMNLTRITEPEDVANKHFADSLSALPHIPQGARCIDIGAGAGLPGIPLSIARPDIRLTMLDSLAKRVAFLRDTCAALSIPATCIHARAEDAGQNGSHRAQYDVALARAVAPLNVLLELLAPFVRVGGVCIAYKGSAAMEELAAAESAAKKLRLKLSLVQQDAAYGERALVLAHKLSPTPAIYPRKAGIPAKNPL